MIIRELLDLQAIYLSAVTISAEPEAILEVVL